jgi:hypothetical protein
MPVLAGRMPVLVVHIVAEAARIAAAAAHTQEAVVAAVAWEVGGAKRESLTCIREKCKEPNEKLWLMQ